MTLSTASVCRLQAPTALLLPEHQKAYLACKSALFEPREFCAALLGPADPEQLEVRRIHPLRNYARSRQRFVIKARELMDCVGPEEQLVAFYHSHAGGPQLSRWDKAAMARLPVVWLIGSESEQGFTLAAWYPALDDIDPVPILSAPARSFHDQSHHAHSPASETGTGDPGSPD